MTNFLRVASSASSRPWQERLKDPAQALALSQKHGLSDILARVVAGREIKSEAVEDYLNPTLKNLMPDPFVLTGLKEGVARLVQAVQNKEQIAIFGDYDVDGATAAAVLYRYFMQLHLKPIIHIPDRLSEGYGPNAQAIETLQKQGATLLVTVDCGTTSHDILGQAHKNGLDIVVIDHHQADVELPHVTALINPKRQDDLSGLDYLAACGVVFMVVVALNRALREANLLSETPDLFALLDCVALGTVADMVPLVGLNRAFVKRGLEVMRKRENAGLTALMDISRVDKPPEPYHLGFLLGPRINAGGRVGDAALGARLLTLKDPLEANKIAFELNRLNQERQVIEAAALEEALQEAQASVTQTSDVVICAGENWHPGVVGLVASRLKENFKHPAFAITFERGETGVGSGRSIAGVDLGKIIREAVAQGLLLKGGGHAMAAGLTIKREMLLNFRAFLEERIKQELSLSTQTDALLIDAALSARAATPAFIKEIDQAAPFGMGNAAPVFAFPAHEVTYVAQVGEKHLKLTLKSHDGATLQAIAFRVVNTPLGDFLTQSRGQNIHFAGTLALDYWQGKEKVQLRIIDAARVQ